MKLTQERIDGIISNPGSRDDLQLMQLAISLGFEPHQERGAQEPWPILGEQPITFVKDVKHIWFAPKTIHGVGPQQSNTYIDPWKCADLIDGKFCNHRSYDLLQQALESESGVKNA